MLERLPTEAPADLTERLVDPQRAEDVPIAGHHGIRDSTDAEESGDEHEPDDEDLGAREDEPQFSTLRAERDGFVTVHPRKHEIVVVTSRGGRPVRVQTVIAERRG